MLGKVLEHVPVVVKSLYSFLGDRGPTENAKDQKCIPVSPLVRHSQMAQSSHQEAITNLSFHVYFFFYSSFSLTSFRPFLPQAYVFHGVRHRNYQPSSQNDRNVIKLLATRENVSLWEVPTKVLRLRCC